MPPAETDTSSPSTPLGTSVLVATPVAGLSTTSAPCLVTAMIAGGTAAAGLADTCPAGADADGVTVTVCAGAGLAPAPHAHHAAATAAPPRRGGGERFPKY